MPVIEEATIANIIAAAGYDWESEHFAGTPARWIRTIMEFKRHDEAELKEILSVDFEEAYSGMVLIRNIPFASLCPHHLLPYMGVAHVAYLPSGRVVGISKLARLVEYFTHQITVQEAATKGIVDAIHYYLKPAGAIAMLTASHSCMSARGIRAAGTDTRTVDLFGTFMENAHGCRDEFYAALQIN